MFANKDPKDVAVSSQTTPNKNASRTQDFFGSLVFFIGKTQYKEKNENKW
jgi:hypothetical protein